MVRSVVDYWWAPFHDTERDRPASALTGGPWVRLYLGYDCPLSREPESFSTQSNMVRPVSEVCTHCAAPLATDARAPGIRHPAADLTRLPRRPRTPATGPAGRRPGGTR